MPYDIKNYKGASIASVLEGTVNTQTPLKLVGQNYKNYGQLIAENFVHIIENFSRDIAPTNPIVGQLWYKPADGHIYMLDQDANNKTKWKSMATMDIRTTDPVDDPSGYTPREGDFWFNSAADAGILNIRYRNDETGALTWGQLSVPVAADATLLFQNVYDDSAAGQTTTPPVSHACIKFVVDNKVIALYSTGEKEWSPLGKLLGTPLQISSGGSSVTYDVESNPDGSSLHLNFPFIASGLTLSGPYDPDVQSGSTEGRSYHVKFPAPAAGGTIAEGYPVINKALQSIESIVITNQGSGYTTSTISAWNTSGSSNFDQIPVGQGPSGTAPTLTAVLGTAGSEFEDKIVSVTVGNDTNSKAGGNGYFTPPIRPSLNGNIRVGRNSTDFADFRNLQAGFGRKITAINIVGAGTGYTNGTVIIQDPSGEAGTTATATITTDSGVITTVTMGQQGDGYTYAPSTANSGITFTGTAGAGNSDAVLLAVLGDDRLMLDANSISGDKLHGGNISGFESSAISDLSNWHRNDPGIRGLTARDGYGTDEGQAVDIATVHDDDKALWGGGTGYTYAGGVGTWTMEVTNTADSEQKRRAGYVNVAYEREQTLGVTSGVVTADGALRVDGGAHIGKNLHVNGSVSVTGSLYTGGSINNIEVNNLTIEDNLIELNKSQTDLAPANAGSAPLAGISGLFIDRGLLASAQVPFSTLLWDDSDFLLSGTTPTGGGPINKQEDFFKLGTFTGKTEPETPDDPDVPSPEGDGSLNQDTISGFKLANLDALMYTAQAGVKCDIISDSQGHESVPTDRDVGGYIGRYNGWPQDGAAAIYPNTLADADVEYDNNNTGYPGKDLILVDSDERIIRGEFHFYRDAYPCDGGDKLVNVGSPVDAGGASSGKTSGHSGNNLYIIKDGNVTTQVDSPGTYMRGSGGPGVRYPSAGATAIDLDATSPDITSATWAGVDSDNSFLEDPIWFVDGGLGQVCALREGRSLGWNRPRIHVHDTHTDYGTGAFVIPIVGPDGTISGAEAMTKGKHYSGTGAVGMVGEARDSTTANTSIGKDGIITVTYATGTIANAGGSGGTGYRTPKPFKEINSTKFNGILCADPSQTNSTMSAMTSGPHVTDSSQKFVGLYPIMDGHNSLAFDQTKPYDGSGMTIGTHDLHFVDAFIKNIRVENHWNDEEALTILNRATHATGTNAKAKINIGALSTHQGKAEIHIYADGGPTNGTGGEGVIQITSSSQGDNQSKIYMQTLAKGEADGIVDIEATTDGQHTAGTQESKAYFRARGSVTDIGTLTFPYGQRQEPLASAVAQNVEDSTTSDDGNEVHVQATDMVVIERYDSDGRTKATPTGTVATMTDWLTRFEVDAKDTRLNGHVHLGDGTLINPGTTDLWDRNVYFNASVASHIMPDLDSNDSDASLTGQGWDLGATNAETSISDHHGGLSVTGATDKRWRTLYVRNISAGAPNQTGLIDGDWSLTAGSTFQSTYTADLAERYEADEELAPGTVVAIGGDNEVTATTSENDTNVFGVVSTEPAFIMNGKAGTDETHPLIAMTGRCPCKVVGKINKGDRLVSSPTTGRARKADLTNDSVYAIIGRAIEAHDSDGEGTIEIAVTRN